MQRLVVACVLSAYLSACSAANNELQPARFVDVNESLITQLQQHIQHFIGGAPVVLADTVLTDSNTLYIERVMLKDAQGTPLSGRDAPFVTTFTLWQNARAQCVLKHNKSDKVVVVKGAVCIKTDEKS